MDLRLEKEFGLGFGRLGLFVDVYNLLGNRFVTTGENPGGTWRPTTANTTAGTYTAASTYGRVTNLIGVRTFKFSARLVF